MPTERRARVARQSRRPSAEGLIAAAQSIEQVSGLTHNFYRYPARFSPLLARAAIRHFTRPGDIVLDPFMGGGTTLVEALASGRNAVGTDISSLAAFVSQTKTTIFSERELLVISEWLAMVTGTIHIHKRLPGHRAARSYPKHLDLSQTWRIRKGIEQAIQFASTLRPTRVENLARCIVLRTAQWALDGRNQFPSIAEFKEALRELGLDMIDGARELAQTVEATGKITRVSCIHRSAIGLERAKLVTRHGPPKLVLMSPPYPGVHVLYHRWQVLGGKETAAPFWVANRTDGSGGAYYTMGHHNAQTLSTYFSQLEKSLRSVVAVSDKKTTFIQVVAFSDPDWQLPRYLSVADDAGLEEVLLPELKGTRDGRLWRSVPHRKWYTDLNGRTSGSEEVVLIHRIR